MARCLSIFIKQWHTVILENKRGPVNTSSLRFTNYRDMQILYKRRLITIICSISIWISLPRIYFTIVTVILFQYATLLALYAIYYRTPIAYVGSYSFLVKVDYSAIVRKMLIDESVWCESKRRLVDSIRFKIREEWKEKETKEETRKPLGVWKLVTHIWQSFVEISQSETTLQTFHGRCSFCSTDMPIFGRKSMSKLRQIHQIRSKLCE